MNNEMFHINNIHGKSGLHCGIYAAAVPIKLFTKPAFIFIIKSFLSFSTAKDY